MINSDIFEGDSRANSPAKAVRMLDVLPEAERHRLLYEWNDTATEFPRDKCVHQLFEEQVLKTPDATAVVFEDTSLSYVELNCRANQLAHYLRGLGVKPDSRVAICVERGCEMIVALLAVLKAGGAYVPLDSAYPAERLRFMIDDSAPVALLTQRHLEGLFAGVGDKLPALVLTEAALWSSQPESDLDCSTTSVTSDHLAYVMYTSGSTGVPKGVMVEHRSVVRLVRNTNYVQLSPSHVVAQASNASFDAATFEVWGALLAGARLVHINKDALLSPTVLARDIQQNGITTLFLTTALFHQIACDAVEAFTNLRYLLVGGDRIEPRWVARVLREGKVEHLLNAYGPTETTTFATWHEVKAVVENKTIPIGRPIANTRVYILDEHGQPVPVGIAGELYIGGAGVARGYWNRSELTAEKFLKDPFVDEPGARMYRTGDLGLWLEDGSIEFLGRNDCQVKIRGFRIELGEIEARLMEHPAVREAAVIAREDTPGYKWLVAYYTSASDKGTLSAEQLRLHLSAVLPEYMVPAAYVRLESLPKMPNGKLDRKAFPAPEADAYSTHDYQTPQGEIETMLAAAWADVLKLDRIGRQDNFFFLGGHSLLAVRLVTRLRQTLGIEVAMRELFEHPVLADFARSVSLAAPADLPLLVRAERGEEVLLSYGQQRLWFLAQMEGVSQTYHIFYGYRLRGELEAGALRRALDRIVERHEALRTVFVAVEGEPRQRIQPPAKSRFDLREYDLRGQAEAGTEVERMITEEVGTVFDLERGPLIRGRLICEAEKEHALLITMHHIVSDGWSMDVFLNELSELYGAFVRGEADPVPGLELQYADYAVWQRKWMGGEILQRQSEYWKRALRGSPALLELPGDYARPKQQSYAGGWASLVLEEELTEKLKELSRRHGVTLFMTLLAGWAVLLARLSGEQDIVIGTPTANRGRQEVEGLIGFFVNTLALRLDVRGSQTVGELLEGVKKQALAAQQHQDLPFEQVVELVRPVRSMGHSPVFQVMFSWENSRQDGLRLRGLEVERLRPESDMVATFDLTLALGQEGERITGGVEYARSLFKGETIERWIGHFRRLLRGMVENEAGRIDRVPLLTEEERERVLVEWNDTAKEFPAERCIHELFEAQVERTPDAVAVVYEEQELSYGELNRRANRLAHYLRELGVRPDGRVAIAVERGLEMMVGLLGVLKAGGAYVPLDPEYPRERLSYMLEDSGATVLLTQGHQRERFEEMGKGMRVLDLSAARPEWAERRESNPDRASSGLTSRHLAYIMYTSGSTGTPKGVMIEHRGVVNELTWTQATYNLNADDAVLQKSSFTFDASISELFWPLIAGARVVMARPQGHKDPAYVAEAVGHHGITTMLMVPSELQVFLEYADSTKCGSLKCLIAGGEVLPAELVRRFQTRLPGAGLHNSYGPTETTVDVTAWPCPVEVTQARIPIGRPLANTSVYVLDRWLEPVPIGVRGELYVSGAGLAHGYLNRPELTAERFVPNAFAGTPGARMYRTGDLARWLPDGNIEFAGRNDHQVKIRGFRIELEEIEARLAEHSGVAEALVLAREDTPGNKRLVAYYTCADTNNPSDVPGADVLRSHLAASLPEYMVPAVYMRLESVPLTPNGKLDRKALPVPGEHAYAMRGYEAPRGEIETALSEIWAEVLQVKQVGRDDNFFELGGHSLLVVRVVARIRSTLNVEVSIGDLFVRPTLTSLAEHVIDLQFEQLDAEQLTEMFNPTQL